MKSNQKVVTHHFFARSNAATAVDWRRIKRTGGSLGRFLTSREPSPGGRSGGLEAGDRVENFHRHFASERRSGERSRSRAIIFGDPRAVLYEQQLVFFFIFARSKANTAIGKNEQKLVFSETWINRSNFVRKPGQNLPSISFRGSVVVLASGHHGRRLTKYRNMVIGFAAFAHRFSPWLGACCLFGAALIAAPIVASPASAQDSAQDLRAEQARLAETIRHHPTDYESTYRYVRLSAELKDYEAAIGALERLLMFNPGLSRANKELGFLYARLGAYRLAAQHLRKALASGGLDAVQVAQIESHLPDIEKQNEASRWYGRLQVGLRSQSNADFFPSAGLFSVGGIDRFSVSPRQSDVNAFELAHVAHDLDFQNQRGDKFETRISGYATQQFNLDRYNVGLLSVSAGPRLALAPDLAPGVSVKPYVTGLVSYLGSVNYLNAGGVGFSLFAPIGSMFSVEPGFEWRSLSVNSRGLFRSVATLGGGNAIQGYVTGVLKPDDDVRLETRLSFTRGNAGLSSQSFDQIEVQAMLRLDFDPPFDLIGRKWTLAPYGRVFQVAYDSANFLIDPFRARRDVAWTTGLAFEAPITANFGFASSIEFSRNDSNLPNFRSHDFSVAFGPVAKF
jgi:tetratricopeptide (TPR) repeat protein